MQVIMPCATEKGKEAKNLKNSCIAQVWRVILSEGKRPFLSLAYAIKKGPQENIPGSLSKNSVL